MDALSSNVSADLSRLGERDKAELQQFINNEMQRARIQSSTETTLFVLQTPALPGASYVLSS